MPILLELRGVLLADLVDKHPQHATKIPKQRDNSNSLAEDIILLSLCSLGKEGVDLENLWETSMAIYIQKQQEQQLKQQLQQQLHKQQLHQLTDRTKQLEQKQNRLEAMLDVELPAMRAKIDSLEINNADNVQEIAVLR